MTATRNALGYGALGFLDRLLVRARTLVLFLGIIPIGAGVALITFFLLMLLLLLAAALGFPIGGGVLFVVWLLAMLAIAFFAVRWYVRTINRRLEHIAAQIHSAAEQRLISTTETDEGTTTTSLESP